MLYTIGTSNRSAEDFFGTLKSFGITRLVDVRSSPRSRIQHFRHPEIMLNAVEYGLKYTWQGKLLGGLNEISTDDPEYRKLADALVTLSMKEEVAICCAEGDPSECHRSWKVGAYALANTGMIVQNILRNNTMEDITKTLVRTRYDWMPHCIRDKAVALAAEAEGYNFTPAPAFEGTVSGAK